MARSLTIRRLRRKLFIIKLDLDVQSYPGRCLRRISLHFYHRREETALEVLEKNLIGIILQPSSLCTPAKSPATNFEGIGPSYASVHC
jgi:hypothetical protein